MKIYIYAGRRYDFYDMQRTDFMRFLIILSSWEKDLMGMENNRQCLFKYYLNKNKLL